MTGAEPSLLAYDDTPHVDDTPPWAATIVDICLGVAAGERVLLIVDEPLSHVRDALVTQTLRAGPAELWTYTFPDASRPFATFPERLIALAVQMDVVALLVAHLDPVLELPAHVAARLAIAGSPARYAVGAYLDDDILAQELSADYTAIAAQTTVLADRLAGSASVQITTARGTDLRLSVAGRQWRTDTGLLRGRGVYGNLSAGEVYIAPLEDSAEGVVMIDATLPGLVLPEPVRVVFEHDRVSEITGGVGADYLLQAIATAEKKPDGTWARVIGELGIGTNPAAQLRGNVMTDEKVVGTIHVAIGRNDMLGGINPAPLHLDAVVTQPTVVVDGNVIIDQGQLLDGE